MNDQLPALILLIVACVMFGAFDYYNLPWLYRYICVITICAIPILIIKLIDRRKKNAKDIL